MTDEHRQIRSGTEIRSKAASVVWGIAVVCATLLVVGALLIALGANPDNVIRDFFVGAAEFLDGPFTRQDGLFTFDGDNAETLSVLVNWGLAAVVYLVIGSLIKRLLRR